MRSILTSLAILTTCYLLPSCNSAPETPGGNGVVLITQPMVADVGGASVGEVVKGSAVECIGFSPDSSTVKIRYGGLEGWVYKATIVFNARPAIGLRLANGYKEGIPSASAINQGTILAVDSTADDMSHVIMIAGDIQIDYWVKTTDISTDPKDIALIVGVENLSRLPANEHHAAYRKLLEENAGGYFARSFKVNLSEAPETAIADLQNRFSISVSKSSNTVTLPVSDVNGWLTSALNQIFNYRNPDYETTPRGNYFDQFITQLPDFVNNGPRYEFAKANAEYLNLDENQSFKAYLLFRIDRSPENIQLLWDNYGDLILPYIRSGQAAAYITDLVAVHDHIFSLPDYKGKCDAVRKEVADWDKAHPSFVIAVYEQREFYNPILHEPTMSRYADNDYNTTGYWLHSFWVRRLAEGNADVVYKILKEISQRPDFNTGSSSASADDSTPKTITCTFQDAGLGDCYHAIFDCGDYGDADISQLDEESRTLWRSLAMDDEGGVMANRAFVGKQFIMKVGTTRGSACNEGQGGEGDVPLLLEFRLAGN